MFSARHWREIRRFLGTLRAETYDAVLDLQGLYKSGFIAEIAHGPAFGLDRKSAREAGASWFYSHRFPVPRQQHAIDRNRQLAAQALDYPLPASWSYGLSVVGADLSLARPYVVFFHGTSRADKLWSQPSWSALIRYFGTRGCQCVLPWGNEEEHTVSTSLTLGHAHAIVPPRRTLAELARLCKGAVGVIGVDTGLTHFAAAVGTPVVGIYCGSDPALTGVRAGEAPAKNVGTKGQAPDVAQVIAAVDTLFNRSS